MEARTLMMGLMALSILACETQEVQERNGDGPAVEDTTGVSRMEMVDSAVPAGYEYSGVVTFVDGDSSGATAVLTDRVEEEQFEQHMLKFPDGERKSLDKHYGEHVDAVCTPSKEGDSTSNCKIVN